MPSRTPGSQPDPAAELLGRWQAHHEGHPESVADDQEPEEPTAAVDDPTDDSEVTVEASVEPVEADVPNAPNAPAESTGPVGPDVQAAPATAARQPRHAAPRTAPTTRSSAARFDQTEAAREVIEALGIPTPPDPTPTPAPAPSPAEQPRSRAVTPVPTPGTSTDVEFAPRVLVRRLLGLLLLALVPATVVAGYLAYDDPTTLAIGAAGTLLVLTVVLYALRVSSTPARLAIHGGQLEVVRGNQREVFDLTSRFTRMEVVGRPGRPGWKVLMARFGRDPLVIDSSMVDPVSFTAALERHRPRQP